MADEQEHGEISLLGLNEQLHSLKWQWAGNTQASRPSTSSTGTVDITWRTRRLTVYFDRTLTTVENLKTVLAFATNIPTNEQQLCTLPFRYSNQALLSSVMKAGQRKLMLMGQPAPEKLAQENHVQEILAEIASEEEAERLRIEEEEREERERLEEEARLEAERREEERRKWLAEQQARQELLHRQQQRIEEYRAMLQFSMNDDHVLDDDDDSAFTVSLRALPLSFWLASGSAQSGSSSIEENIGNRIIAPDSLLGELIKRRRRLPPTFKIAGTAQQELLDDDISLFAGVLEFSAPPGICYLPDAMMTRLQLVADDSVTLRLVATLPKASSVVLQPVQGVQTAHKPWLDVDEEERQALLEQTLRGWYSLNVGDRITLPPNYQFDVVDVDPSPAAAVTDIDLVVHILDVAETPSVRSSLSGGSAATSSSSSSSSSSETSFKSFSLPTSVDCQPCQHCKKPIPTRTHTMHEMRCARLIKRCTVCGLDTPELEAHMALHKATECSLCSLVLEAQHLAEHQANDCPRRPVACNWCARNIEADLIDEHAESCSSRTAQCLLCAFQATKRVLMLHIIQVHSKNQTTWKAHACEVSLE